MAEALLPVKLLSYTGEYFTEKLSCDLNTMILVFLIVLQRCFFVIGGRHSLSRRQKLICLQVNECALFANSLVNYVKFAIKLVVVGVDEVWLVCSLRNISIYSSA